MTKWLLARVGAAKRLSVKQSLARLILVFVFLAGTLHAPAMAHPASSDHRAAHGDMIDLGAHADHHDEPASSPDGATDNLHHHHCPAAVSAGAADVTEARVDGEQFLAIHRAAALSSFSQAPPTEPPSA